MKNTDAIKANDAFLAWLRTKESCISGNYSEYVNGEGKSVVAHVRRSRNSGTSYKPLFSALPLTKDEHDFQHAQGELACIRRYGAYIPPQYQKDVETAKLWFENAANEYFAEWMVSQATPEQHKVVMEYFNWA